MRKIEKEMVHFVRYGTSWKSGNTRVAAGMYDGNVTASVYLHGNGIFTRYYDSERGEVFEFSLCGWPSVTTRSRLNALFTAFCAGVGISQSDYEQYLSINGDSVRIDESNTYQITRRNDESEWTIKSRF